MILEEKHQLVAKEIIQRNRKKKSCNKCYDRGFIGFTTDKTIIPCEKCVEIDTAMEEWKRYVSGDEELKEQFNELFLDEDGEATSENDESENITEDEITDQKEDTEVKIDKDNLTTSSSSEEAKKIAKSSENKVKKGITDKSKPPKTTMDKQKQKTSVSKTNVNTPKATQVRKTSARGK
ncbi:MAG: hypothetical protein FWG98_04150 [Candidatus Cloacimonetes bacterium]|nr:hypothetical protein [Candidatus Cloacimonadota bacterium]